MRKIAVAVLASTLSVTVLTGCIGQFALTDKLYQWNKRAGDKWVAEGIFLVTGVLLPVYSLTLLADGVVLNSVEFWTGVNPVSNKRSVLRSGDSRTLRGQQGSEAVMSFRDDGRVDVAYRDDKGVHKNFTLEKRADSIVALNAAGVVLAQADNAGRMQ